MSCRILLIVCASVSDLRVFDLITACLPKDGIYNEANQCLVDCRVIAVLIQRWLNNEEKSPNFVHSEDVEALDSFSAVNTTSGSLVYSVSPIVQPTCSTPAMYE